jgi:MOSC domain-containing protein YiiM
LHPDEIRIVSVNVGKPESLEHGGRSIVSGIQKRPVSGRVMLGEEKLAGDTICDLEHHGGKDQAVYVYRAEDYAWWTGELADDCPPGTFGENLTVEGLPHDLAVGDRLLIGEVVLEATSPRIPCSTLAARMQDSNFGLLFRRARRPGTYFRVLNGGELQQGDRATFVPGPNPDASLLTLFDLAFDTRPDVTVIEQFLDAPLAERARKMLERKLPGNGER